MNSAAKRILSALVLLAIFALALSLRFYGLDWGYKDGSTSQHPDEWHYEGCAGDLNIMGLTLEEKKLPWDEQLKLYYERNLNVVEGQSKVGQPGLKIRNYNYGTFPLFLYVFYKDYLVKHYSAEHGWNFLAFPDWLSLTLLAFVLILGFRMFLGMSRDMREIEGRRIPWYKDELRLMFFFPCMIIPITGLVTAGYLPNLLIDFSRYNPSSSSILIIGRAATAYAGALTVLLAYLIGRDAYNRAVGLIAALMLATAMLHVQTSHFATTDVILGFWTTAAVYCFLKISQKPRLMWYVLGAISVGCAVGTKWSGVTLPGILFIAHAAATLSDKRNGKVGRAIHSVWLAFAALILGHFLMAARSVNPSVNVTMAAFRDFYWTYCWWFAALGVVVFLASIYLLILRKRWHGGEVGWLKPIFQIYIPWAWLAVAVVVGLAAFMASEPMAYFDSAEFGKSVSEQAALNATGERPVVYTHQYRNTLPVIHSIDNLFYPSLDWLTAFFVVAGCLYALGRLYKEGKSSDLVLSAWVIPSFILYSCVHSKFPRYMDAVLPVMMVMGARMMVDLARVQPSVYVPSMAAFGDGWRRLARGVGRYGGAAALVCGLIYGVSYVGIYSRTHPMVAAGKWMRENMKPGAKVTDQSWDNPIAGIHVEGADRLGVHDRWEEEQRNPKERVRYLVGMLRRFDYIALPSKRGYGTTFQNPDRYPITNQFLKALFAEQLGFRVAKVFDNPPRFLGWQFRTDEEDETARVYDHPKVVIFERTDKLSEDQLENLILNPPDWVNEITASEVLGLQDGHPVYAPPPQHPLLKWGILVFFMGWISFILLFPIASYLPDRGYGISKVIGLALFGWMSWFLASVGVFSVSSMQGAFVLACMLGSALLVYKAKKNEIHDFIKQKAHLLIGLEILFILVWGFFLVVRAYHPAEIGGEKPMNSAFINAVYRAETFPPEDPWMSGYPVNYYYYGHAVFALAGRFVNIPPEYLFNIAGTSVSALAALAIFSLAYALSRKTLVSLFAVYLSCFAGHFLSYLNFVKFELVRSGRLAESAAIGVKGWFAALIPIGQHMYYSILYYLGMGSPEVMLRLRELNYNHLFWDSSRVIPNTVANEFPYWTHLFLDFHAHLLVIPFTFAFMVLLYNYFARPREEMRLGNTLGLSFFLGLLLGTVICTNTWDLPALGIALLLITVVKFYREAGWFNQPAVRPEIVSPDSLHRFLQFPIAPVALIGLFAVLLFVPFHVHFVSRVSEVGVMTEGNTLISTYLGFWIHLLAPIVVCAVLFAAVRSDGRISVKRSILFACFFMCSTALALWMTQANFFHFPKTHDVRFPLNYSIVGLFLPVFLVFFLMMWRRKQCSEFVFACLLAVLGLGLSLGIEIFYIKEGWLPPTHRWNTAFKFNLQVWHYLSIFTAIACVWVWKKFEEMGERIGSWFNYAAKLGFLFLMILVLIPTIPFAVMGPALVTAAGGSSADMRDPRPSLDGLGYLRNENRGSYDAVQWCNRFLNGTPRIVELSYRHGGDHARFSSYTGLPALIGWPHHTRERNNYVAPQIDRRVGDMDRIYTSNDPQEVLSLVGRYGLQYLVFGAIERDTRRGDQSDRAPLGAAGLERIEKMGGVFQLVYRNKDTSIFRINKSLNRVYGMATDAVAAMQQSVPPAMRPPERGVRLFEGGRGDGNGRFNEPRGMVADATGFVYLADTRNYRMQVFRPDGMFAWKVGEEGPGNGEFNEPNDVAIDPQNGNIYVVDSWNHRVVLFARNGSFLGVSQAGFFGPRGIAFHPKWRLLYLTDTGNHRVVVMTPEGKILQTWGRLGDDDDGFREPVGIDVMPDGNVAVVDGLNKRVKIYTAQGKSVRIWPIQTTWTGGSGFEGHVACAADGTIYLTDPKEASVHLYNAEGELLGKIETDIQKRPLRLPVGITITPQNRVLVSDLMRNQVVVVK